MLQFIDGLLRFIYKCHNFLIRMNQCCRQQLESLAADVLSWISRSPYLTKSDNPQKDLVDPAVNGTTNLLKAVAKSKDTVKRVVLTSSVAGKHSADA